MCVFRQKLLKPRTYMFFMNFICKLIFGICVLIEINLTVWSDAFFRSARAHGRLPLRRNACSRTDTPCKRRFHRNRAARQLFSRSNSSAARGRAMSSCNPMRTMYDYPDLSRRNIACKPNSKRVHDSLLSTGKYHIPSRELPCRSLQLRGSSANGIARAAVHSKFEGGNPP